MSTNIEWEITINSTLGVSEVAKGADPDGADIETNFSEVQLDFVPSIDYTSDFFHYMDDPDTGDERLDKVLIEIVDSFGMPRYPWD